jgi:hypothetical protein
MKNALNVLILLICLLAGFFLARAYRPFMQWWNKPGFEHAEPTLLTGVGDAPEHRGFVLDGPIGDPGKTFGEWKKRFVTAVGIAYSDRWTPEQVAETVKVAHGQKLTVTLMPPGGSFSKENPYAAPLGEIAGMAHAAKVDRLVIAQLNDVPDTAYWRDQAEAVRKVFKGKVLLASTDTIAPALTIWNLSDALAIAGPIRLPRRLPHASDTITFHDMRVAWDTQISAIESLARGNGKKVVLLNIQVPVSISMKLPVPGSAAVTVPANPKLQAIAYEALLAETKGRTSDTDTLLMPWSAAAPPSADAFNGAEGLMPKLAEAWDPKKPRTPETAPDDFSDTAEPDTDDVH